MSWIVADLAEAPCEPGGTGASVTSGGATHPPPLNVGLALINHVFPPTSFTYQKHLKLGQCLEIDDRRSLSKFGDVT